MFESIKKAKQLGVLALGRVDDYLELVKLSAEIQVQNWKKQVVSYLMAALFSALSLIFLGLAIIITCWDTPYRLLSAWGVAGIYALIAFLVYVAAPKQTASASAFDVVRDELQQDIKLMKDVV
jgi:uncharacterized membrane protein YqjE